MNKNCKLIKLTPDFYIDHAGLKEIELKVERPYVMLLVQVKGLTFALPFRSGINHEYALMTDPMNNCGIDFSKAVLIDDPKYIDSAQPTIRKNEFSVFKRNQIRIVKEFTSYVERYIKALSTQDKLKSRLLCQYSTLQNYHKELNI